MRYIARRLPPHLPRIWSTILVNRSAAFDQLVTHAERADYLKRHGSWRTLKTWLSALSNGKCWYCESKSARAPFDVDHFRPKLKITVNGVTVEQHEGYHWLAYDWSNFRLSCIVCNRPGSDGADTIGKSNEFPLRDEAHRSVSATAGHEDEEPRLLDPCDEDDCGLLAHGVDGEVRPAGPGGTWEHERAAYTIKQLGFNLSPTPESKRRLWLMLSALIRTNAGNDEVEQVVRSNLSSSNEYSSFLRASISTYRTVPWVRNLL